MVNSVASAPPVMCKGGKTKLAPFILSAIMEPVCPWSPGMPGHRRLQKKYFSGWNGRGRWIEPFLGSGAVVFNLAPKKALLADTNRHIIQLYQDIADKRITPSMVKEFLTYEGALLLRGGEARYHEVRDRFNEERQSLDFLFLNRASKGFCEQTEFDAPFCGKPERFSKAYVTRIANQVAWVAKTVDGKDWTFMVADWKATLSEAQQGDFVYADPPHINHRRGWTGQDTDDLLAKLEALPCRSAFSLSRCCYVWR